jgi:hypothetical protein
MLMQGVAELVRAAPGKYVFIQDYRRLFPPLFIELYLKEIEIQAALYTKYAHELTYCQNPQQFHTFSSDLPGAI